MALQINAHKIHSEEIVSPRTSAITLNETAPKIPTKSHKNFCDKLFIIVYCNFENFGKNSTYNLSKNQPLVKSKMAEKNTRSILESIKNKLSKIDQKSDANSADGDIASEFDYVATHNKPQAPQNNNPDLPAVEKFESVDQNLQNNNQQEVAQNDLNSSAEFGKDDLEDYEHQIDFANPPKEEVAAEAGNLDMNFSNDLNLNEAVESNETAENQQASELKLDDELTFAPDAATPETEENSAPLPKLEEFNLPEIAEENDFLTQENPQPLQEEAPEEDLQLPEGEEEVDEEEEDDEEDEGDEESEEENESDEKVEDNQNPQNPLENHQELPEETAENHEDDLEIDDLQHPNHDHIENVNVKEADPYESELELLERELEEQAKKQNSHLEPIEESVAQSHDIELELEKDMMNFNSQNPNLNKFSAPAKLENAEIEAPIQQKTDSQILSEKTIEQSREAINQIFQVKEILPEVNNLSDAKLKEIAVEILTPKLDKWLNNNLPKLVEDIVRQEIKKIIPK